MMISGRALRMKLITVVMLWFAVAVPRLLAENTFEGTGIVVSLDKSAGNFTVGRQTYYVADLLTVKVGNVDTPLLDALSQGSVVGFSGRVNAAGEQVVDSIFISGKRVQDYALPIAIDR